MAGLIKRTAQIGAMIGSMFVLQAPAVSQTQPTICDEMVVSISQWCDANWQDGGWSSVGGCFDDVYGGSCPEQHADGGSLNGPRDYRIYWFPVCRSLDGIYFVCG